MDFSTSPIIKIIYALLASLLLFGLYNIHLENETEKKVNDQKIYASMEIDNVLTTLENPVTSITNDFFVITNDDKAFYVTVGGEENNHNQITRELTENTTQLNSMLVTTMDRANMPLPQNSLFLIPVPIR